DFNALGGADLVTVNDLTGTDVSALNLELAGSLGGTTGDNAAARIVVNGPPGNDAMIASGDPSGVAVSGLKAQVAIQHQEASDELDLNGLAGNDAIDASGLAAASITLVLAGGEGNDTIAGGKRVETLAGDAGNDTVDGNAGNDLALLGAGDDTFIWDPGDGSDVVEGQEGVDTMRFNGANTPDQVDVSANGSRLRFFRNPGNITMDTAGVERVDFNALGGADLVTVNDLTGTDVSALNLELAGSLGGTTGDNAADRIVVNGTPGNDAIDVSGDASEVKVSGLVPTIAIFHTDGANDRLEINTLEGADTVGSAGLAPGAIQLVVDPMPVQ